ncbi:acyl-CoA dehydrogenase family protein [uncultured Mycobacterium sp.]|uniref:acyl-CoA dehydrogenase family protein n=1 Tax=uncultured Mycobacterium sp. TaxID=171292 RepID=UPI0035CB2D2D
MDVETQHLLRESVHELLAQPDVDLVAGLAQLGWHDVVTDDPAAAVDLLFTEQDKAGLASAALDTVLIDAAGGDLCESSAADPPLAVLHPLGAATCLGVDNRLLIDGVTLSDPVTAGGCVAPDGAESTVRLLAPEQLVTAAVPVAGFDPASSLYRVRADVAINETEERKCDWTGAIAAGRRALAAELVGNGSAMLDIAVDHVRQRKQFGRPIGANQSPRHRLAQCYAQLAAARELIDVAWKTATRWDAWVAKTYAGCAWDVTSRACLQVCGAIGLTSEHPLGRYAKRAHLLDALYGGWRVSSQDIGATLLRTESIPAGPPI